MFFFDKENPGLKIGKKELQRGTPKPLQINSANSIWRAPLRKMLNNALQQQLNSPLSLRATTGQVLISCCCSSTICHSGYFVGLSSFLSGLVVKEASIVNS